MPGVEELVNFINRAQGGYLYLGAFLAIFFEGLYFIGSFFPGSTLVLLIAIVAQAGGTTQFFTIIMTIFMGWLLAGVINILLAKYFSHVLKLEKNQLQKLKDNAGVTWFPAFRANTEVAQITEGHSAAQVFLSSARVKLLASAGAAIYALIIPFFVDIQTLDNNEGFWSLGLVALITFGIGIYKIKVAGKQKTA